MLSPPAQLKSKFLYFIVLSALAKNEIELLLDNLNIFSIIEKPFKSKQVLSSTKEALDKAH